MKNSCWLGRAQTAVILSSLVAVLVSAGCSLCDGGYNACALIVEVEVDAVAMGIELGDRASPTPVTFSFDHPGGATVDVECIIDGDGNVAECQFPQPEPGGIEVRLDAFSAESLPSSFIVFEIRRTDSAAGKTPQGIGMTVTTGSEIHYEGEFQYKWRLTDNRGETCQPCAEHIPEAQAVWVPS